MTKLFPWVAAAISAAFLAAVPADRAFAQRRVALVIGNSAYQNVTKLANTVHDSSAIAGLFRQAGFDVVDARQDLGVVEFKRALREFMNVTRGAETAVVYFAGHGIEVTGTNYLIPVDAKLATDYDAEDEAVSLDRIIMALEPAQRLRLVILDACRDNPFGRKMQRTVAVRAVSTGLGRIEPMSTDTLVAYAAKAGSVSYDGTGPNSPFTTALLKYIAEPGIDIRIALGRVRDEVLKITGRQQEPFVYGSLGGTTVALVPAPETKKAEALAVTREDDMRRAYEFASQVGTKEAWQAFINRYPAGFYSELARLQLEKLNAAPAPDVVAARDAKARAEQEAAARADQERAKAAEAERLKAQQEQEAKARAEQERAQRLAAQRQEEERRAKEEVDRRKARAEQEAKARAEKEQAERRAAEQREEERRAKAAEAARLKAQQEQEAKARAAHERAQRLALLQRQEEERQAREEAERRKAREEQEAKARAEKERAQRLTLQSQEEQRRAKAEAERVKAQREAALRAQEKAEFDAEHSCAGAEKRLIRLRANPSREEVARFARELSCAELRPQVNRLLESLGGEPVVTAPSPARPAPSGPSEQARQPALVPSEPRESKTGAAPDVRAQACSRDEERLAQLRANPVREAVARFARELTCEDLRPQVQRLLESVGG